MDSCFKYKWRTSRDESLIPVEPKTFPEEVVLIQLQLKEFVVINNLHSKTVVKEMVRPAKVKNISIGKIILLSKSAETLGFLSNALRVIGVPVHLFSSAIDSIVAFARTMTSSLAPDQGALAMTFEFSAYITETTDES